MAKVVTDDKHYKAIAAAIRNNSDVTDEIKPEEMAGQIGELASFRYYRGETAGAEVGRQAERDDFWSVYLNHGEPKNYQHGFSNGKFTDEIYNPNYPIYCHPSLTTGAQYLFSASGLSDTKVEIIVGANRGLTQSFYNNDRLHTIRKITLLGNNTFSNTFTNCTALENITFEGEIVNDISFADSPKLTKASITNIINCLSATASGKTLTLSIIAVAEAFATDETDGLASDEWAALIATKTNWTISLV